jgi:hypothetical protein
MSHSISSCPRSPLFLQANAPISFLLDTITIHEERQCWKRSRDLIEESLDTMDLPLA